VAGFPELSVFDQLSSYVNFLFGREDRLLAEIYRPAAETLPLIKSKNEAVFAATEQAGRELVTTRQIAPDTLDKIQQPIVDFSTFATIGNAFWKTCIAEGVTPKTFAAKEMRPRPDSIASFMAILEMAFNREAGKDTRAILQFDFSGEIEGACHFKIDCGTIEAIAGQADSPDLTISTPFETWMDIMTGKADGQKMFMQQKYQVTGDLELLMGFGELFGS
jgi:putative sterol carrier protein